MHQRNRSSRTESTMLREVTRGPQWVELASPDARWEIRALAPDLIRLRVAQGTSLSARPSWAVTRTEWGEVETKIQVTETEAVLSTAGGRFSVALRSGGWALHDTGGLEVFRSPGQGTCFAEGKPRLALTLVAQEHLFGLGETTGTFDKRGLIRELWNIDVLGHAPAIHPGLRSLYVSIPFLVSLRQGRVAGVFWDNPARQTWDLGATRSDACQATADSGEIDLYLFLGPTPPEVVGRYTELTGRIPMPPRWALGYHQCRYSYETAERTLEVARMLRSKRLPCDALYLDIHHLDGHRVFTFGKTFPQPRNLLARLRRMGFRTVTIVDPGVKDEPTFGVLKRGRKAHAFVQDPQGRADALGEVWAGRSRFPDFLNARARAWWGREQARLQELGVAGFWNDMNEPAVFSGPGKTLDGVCRHETDTGPMSHAEAHNLYGMQMARASQEGAQVHRPRERPFVITRAGYAGVQRHALVWTGDNSSTWEQLADSLQMLLNLGLSGVAFCGSDAGGFMEHASGELLARWMQMAALTPFFRNHSNTGTRNQEPWAFGLEVEEICRSYLGFRYQLLPYIYGLFAEAHRTGAPIMRALAWHFPGDPVAVSAGDQFLLGSSLLVAPVLRQGATARSVYLPAGNWFDFWSGQIHYGRQHVLAHAELAVLPLFVRAGSLIPLAALRQHTRPTEDSTIYLHLWPGAPAQLTWYEDDGRSPGYASGAYHERLIEYLPGRRGGELRLAAGRGRYRSRVRRWRVMIHGATRQYRLRVGGAVVETEYLAEQGLCWFEVGNSADPFSARWA